MQGCARVCGALSRPRRVPSAHLLVSEAELAVVELEVREARRLVVEAGDAPRHPLAATLVLPRRREVLGVVLRELCTLCCEGEVDAALCISL